ncbi:MAG: TRIC cation channel family protein [Cyanobium sp. M30B3]|nr:MAG: TRIC cation channel family protein [Cyanobium sp. M30B3]
MFWADDLSYIWISLLASALTFLGYRLISRRSILAVLLYLDALGISLFTIQGTAKAWGLGFGLPLAPTILGIITASGGGLISDLLAGRENLLI